MATAVVAAAEVDVAEVADLFVVLLTFCQTILMFLLLLFSPNMAPTNDEDEEGQIEVQEIQPDVVVSRTAPGGRAPLSSPFPSSSFPSSPFPSSSFNLFMKKFLYYLQYELKLVLVLELQH